MASWTRQALARQIARLATSHAPGTAAWLADAQTIPATEPRSRVQPSSPHKCPVCDRPAGLCCVNGRGAVRRGGLHPERVALDAQQAGESS